MSPPGAAIYLDPNTQFFVQQMQAVPGVSPRASAAGAFPYQGTAYAFPNSYSQATAAPEGPNSFEATISGTIMNHGSTSTTVTPTGSQTKKDKKEKNRGNYRCGRCGKPKVNHVCAFVDAVTVSQAVQVCIFKEESFFSISFDHFHFLTVFAVLVIFRFYRPTLPF